MFVLARRSPPRCAYCHEALVAAVSCKRCRAALHEDCRAELGRCPTLGCGGTVFESRDGAVAVFGLPEKAIDALLARVKLEATAIAFGVSLLCMAGSWVLGSFWVLAGIAAAGGVSLLQLSHVRGVRRLLRETRPRRANLRLHSRLVTTKNGSYTAFEGTVMEPGRTLTLELGGDASWLLDWRIDAPIGIYGGGILEPVILFDGNRSRVVRSYNVGRL
jgi:hypothetical protein